MNITELVKRAHDNAVSKGFYECENCDNTGKVLEVCNYYTTCDVCNGKGKAPKNIGELLMLVVSELGEALEAHRKGSLGGHACLIDMFDENEKDQNKWNENFRELIKDSLEDELADAVIRIADMCGYLGIDLEKHIELKMKYNATREYKHGKRY